LFGSASFAIFKRTVLPVYFRDPRGVSCSRTDSIRFFSPGGQREDASLVTQEGEAPHSLPRHGRAAFGRRQL
jgi:hypothetical protein